MDKPVKVGDVIRIGTKNKWRVIGEVVKVRREKDRWLVDLCYGFNEEGKVWSDRVTDNWIITPKTKIKVFV